MLKTILVFVEAFHLKYDVRFLDATTDEIVKDLQPFNSFQDPLFRFISVTLELQRFFSLPFQFSVHGEPGA